MEQELTDKEVKRLKEQPIIESSVTKSQDGKWFIHRTVITDIKSTAYMDKVMGA